MPKIEGIEPSRHVKGRYLLHMEGGTLVKVTENEMVAFALYTGLELEPERLTALQEAAGVSNARALAAKLISHRPLSRKELLGRLEEKGISPNLAASAAHWLEELGMLNDREYAGMIVRHYSRRGYGRKKLEQELYHRGIDRTLWPAALEEATPAEDGIAAFLQTRLRNRDANDPKEIRRVTDALLRRGYSWGQIKEGLQTYGSRVEEWE